MVSWTPVAMLTAYVVFLIFVIHRWGGLRDASFEEFAVAGRSFPWYMVMFTVLATWFVGSIYTGWVGMATMDGSIALYGPLYTLAGLILYYLLAPRVWVWGKVHRLHNLPDFIEMRYRSRRLALFVALAALIIGAPWQVMALKTFGYLSYSLTYGAVPMNVGMAVFALFTLSYIAWGGQRSVVVTDFVQGVISMVLVMGGALFVICKLFGGIGPMMSRLMAEKPELLTVSDPQAWTSWILAGAIGSYCWLEVYNRIFTARSVADVRSVAAGAPIIGGLAYLLILLVGFGGALVPEVAASLETAEAGFFTMFERAGGPLMLGFAGMIVLAAEMSSVDSQLTTAGVVVAKNVIGPFRPDVDDRRLLKWARWVISIWMMIALVIAMMDLPALVQLGIWTYEFLVHLFPVSVLGAFWRRGTAAAGIAGLATGMPITALFTFNPDWGVQVLGSWGPGIVGFSVNLLVYVLVSLASRPEPYVDELFAELKASEDVLSGRAELSPVDAR